MTHLPGGKGEGRGGRVEGERGQGTTNVRCLNLVSWNFAWDWTRPPTMGGGGWQAERVVCKGGSKRPEAG